jgi:hypothetical protein
MEYKLDENLFATETIDVASNITYLGVPQNVNVFSTTFFAKPRSLRI